MFAVFPVLVFQLQFVDFPSWLNKQNLRQINVSEYILKLSTVFTSQLTFTNYITTNTTMCNAIFNLNYNYLHLHTPRKSHLHAIFQLT